MLLTALKSVSAVLLPTTEIKHPRSFFFFLLMDFVWFVFVGFSFVKASNTEKGVRVQQSLICPSRSIGALC